MKFNIKLKDFDYSIVPSHQRTIYFKYSDHIEKFRLNIPQMCVFYNNKPIYSQNELKAFYKGAYYFPIDDDFNTYYSPFLNTYDYGYVCLGDAERYIPEFPPPEIVLTLLYDSYWTLSESLDSYSYYLDDSPMKITHSELMAYFNIPNPLKFRYTYSSVRNAKKYINFLNKWQHEGKLNLVTNQHLKIT